MAWNKNAFGNLGNADVQSALQKSGSSWQLPTNQGAANPYAEGGGGGGGAQPYAGNPVNLSSDQGFQNDVARQVAASNGMQKRAEAVDANGGNVPAGGGGGGNAMSGLASIMGSGGGGGTQESSGTTDKASQLGNLWSVFGKIFGGGG